MIRQTNGAQPGYIDNPHVYTTSVLGFEVVTVCVCSAFQSSKFCLVKAFLLLFWGSKTLVYETSECREQPVLKRLTCQHDSWLLLIRKDFSSFLHCTCWICSIGKGQRYLLGLTTAREKSLESQGSLQTRPDSHPYQTNWDTWLLRFFPQEGTEIVKNPRIHPPAVHTLLNTCKFSKKDQPTPKHQRGFQKSTYCYT